MGNKRVPDTKTKWAIERRSQYNLNLSGSVSEVLVGELAESCCVWGTATVREPEERDLPALEAATGGPMKTH
jgi:hypothetical protein